jgi:hypothetical protein
VTESGQIPNDDDLRPSERPIDRRGGGLGHGPSGYADGLRRAKAGRRKRREQLHQKRRDAAHAAYVVAALVMGAAVVAAAAVAVLVFAGVFPGSPGPSAAHRTEPLERHSSGTTTAPPSSGTTTAPPSSPSTTTAIEAPALPPSNPVAIRGTTTRAQTRALPPVTRTLNTTASSTSPGAEQLSSTSLPPPSTAPAPARLADPADHRSSPPPGKAPPAASRSKTSSSSP